MMTVNQNNIKSFESSETKQEGDIKEEPECVVGFDEVSTSIYCNIRTVSSVDGCDAECDFLNLDVVKDELMEEYDDKKEEEPRANADSGEATDGQRKQQLPSQDEDDFFHPESDDNVQNIHNQAGDAPENSQKQHKCNFCKYSTVKKYHLNQHLLKHTGEKPHACGFCPKRFTQKQYLRAHMKVHVEEFMFHCTGCLQGFNEKDEKMAHETNCKLRHYECHLCNESFGSSKQHIRIVVRHLV